MNESHAQVGVWPETTVEDEQRILSGILQQLPEEVRNREARVKDMRRRMQAQPWDEGQAIVLARAEENLNQARRVLQGEPAYFARLRGKFVDCEGMEFTEDIRVSAFANMEEWEVDGRPVVIVSFRAGIADVVRNPSVAAYVEDETGGARGRRPGRVEVYDAVVEDVEIRHGQVVRVAPRYTTVWEDRVRNRLLRVGTVGLDAMADVLDPEQSRILADREPRVMVVEGPAGTGKTAVALHRVAILSGQSDVVLYVVPTPALASYIEPALPRLGLNAHRFVTVTPWDLLRMVLSVDLPFHAEEDDPWLADQISNDPQGILSCLRSAYSRAEESMTSRLRIFLETALAVVRTAMPGSEAALQRYETTYRGKPLVVNLVELIPSLGRGRLAGSHQERARFLFDALMKVAEGNSTASAFLSKSAFDEFLGQAKVDWADVYRSAMLDYLGTHGRTLPTKIAVTRSGAAALLAFAAEMGFGLPAPPRWVVVDEAQSFNPMFYRALASLADPSAHFVVSGDLQQDTVGHGTLRSWEEALSALGPAYSSAAKRVTLTRVYRLPLRIHNYAHAIFAGRGSAGNVTHLHPVEGEVQELIARSGEEQERFVREVIVQAWKRDLSSIVVIAPTVDLARRYLNLWERKHLDTLSPSQLRRATPQLLDGSQAYRGGLAFASVEAMAGLEADVIIVTDVDTIHYPKNDLAARRLHTACSRARRLLVVIAVEDPTRKELLEKAKRAADSYYRDAVERVRRSAEQRLRTIEAELAQPLTGRLTGHERHGSVSRREILEFTAEALRTCVKDPEAYLQVYTQLREQASGRRLPGRNAIQSDAVWYWPARELQRAKDEYERRIRDAEVRIPADWDSTRRRRSKLLPENS